MSGLVTISLNKSGSLKCEAPKVMLDFCRKSLATEMVRRKALK